MTAARSVCRRAAGFDGYHNPCYTMGHIIYGRYCMKLLYVLEALGALAAAAAGIVVCDANRFVIRKYTMKSGKINGTYRFVMLSDLHGKSYGKNNERLMKAIDRINPEGIYIAGDMITAKLGKDFDRTAAFIRRLSEKYPVYYGSGNHEYRMEIYPKKYKDMSARYEASITGAGIERLKNRKVIVKNRNIAVYGIEIDKEFYKKLHVPKMTGAYIEKKLGKPDKERFNILIAHNPSYFPAYAAYGADLVLAGHVHGGIARLPLLGGVISPSLRLFPKYDGGRYEEGESVMILGRGLGTHTIPVRFFNPGELVEIVVHPR